MPAVQFSQFEKPDQPNTAVAHRSHADCAVRLYRPAVQLSQCDDCRLAWNVPGTQFTQTE